MPRSTRPDGGSSAPEPPASRWRQESKPHSSRDPWPGAPATSRSSGRCWPTICCVGPHAARPTTAGSHDRRRLEPRHASPGGAASRSTPPAALPRSPSRRLTATHWSKCPTPRDRRCRRRRSDALAGRARLAGGRRGRGSARCRPTNFWRGRRWRSRLTAADLVGAMEGALDAGRPTYAEGAAASTACRSARSRPCSTCSPRPTSLIEGSLQRRRSTPPGRSTRSPPAEALAAAAVAKAYCARARPHRVRDRDPGARRHRQHVGVPGPRVPPAGAAVERRSSAATARSLAACSRTSDRGAAHGLR